MNAYTVLLRSYREKLTKEPWAFWILVTVMAPSLIMISCAQQHNPPINPSHAVVTAFEWPSIAITYSGGVPVNDSFDLPYAVAVDKAGYAYVADAGNDLILKISPA
jgi:hypothetical protein